MVGVCVNGSLTHTPATGTLDVAADVVRAAALAWIPVAALLDVLTIGQVYAVELVVGVATVY